jgi:[protein-PII] uridylyltransferase
MALEIFDVEPTFDRPVEWSRIEAEVTEALSGGMPLADRLRQRDTTYARNRRPASAYPTQVQVRVDNQASDRASIIEVRAIDRLGLLHDITVALAREQIDVVSALVDTLGHEVIDTFYVRDPAGNKLTDPAAIASITSVLTDVVAGADEGAA